MSEHGYCKCAKAMTNKFGRCSRCGRDVPVEKVEQTAPSSSDPVSVFKHIAQSGNADRGALLKHGDKTASIR